MADLRVCNLTKTYTDTTALDAVNFEICSGEFVALLGPSGCGKTTTLRLISGFEKPTGGKIYLGDTLLAGHGKHVPPEQRNMAVVFQSYALWPHLSVADNVGYPLKIRKIKGKEYDKLVGEALETVSLTPYANRRPAELSGGQRQRVALARCIVTSPSVVLLDEPLANLDRNLRDSMESYFQAFHQKTGAIMIYITHNQNEAMALADRIAVMDNGRIEQFAKPEELYREPASSFVADFVGEGKQVTVQSLNAETAMLGPHAIPVRRDGQTPRERAQVIIRPEAVTLGEGPFTAQVTACKYKGERYFVSLLLEDGQPLHTYSKARLHIKQHILLAISDSWYVPA